MADREEIESVTLRELRRLALTVEEVQRVLPLGRTAVYEAIASGKIPSIRFGRRILVPIAALEKVFGVEPGAGQ
jgi:excisionase family DNA binding protein